MHAKTTPGPERGARNPTSRAAAPGTRCWEWRFEYRWPDVTEAYDVRLDGVEQTFVVHSRPAAEGDLVVTGRGREPDRRERGRLLDRDLARARLATRGGAARLDLAFDRTTRSHWAVVLWTVAGRPKGVHALGRAVRLGQNGGPLEEGTFYSSGRGSSPTVIGPAVAYDPRRRSFSIVFGTDVHASGRLQRHAVYGLSFTYPKAAVAVPYGIGCGGKIGAGFAPLRGTAAWPGGNPLGVLATGGLRAQIR